MKRIGMTAALLIIALPAMAARKDDPGTAQETLQQIYPLSGMGARSLLVDNVWGSINVTPANLDRIEVVIRKSFRAESAAAMERAKREVTVDAKQEQNAVRIVVRGPFRCEERDCRGHLAEGYVPKMDFDIRVPRDTALDLRTVNEGDVNVRGAGDDSAIHNVNGSISVEDAAGSVRARTVNGSVKVTFRENPTKASEFETINGPINLSFRPGLSADFRFKNLNGGVYTDYELTPLAPAEPQFERRRDGKVIVRTDGFTGGRAGAGGPEIKIENLNGEIRVLETR